MSAANERGFFSNPNNRFNRTETEKKDPAAGVCAVRLGKMQATLPTRQNPSVPLPLRHRHIRSAKDRLAENLRRSGISLQRLPVASSRQAGLFRHHPLNSFSTTRPPSTIFIGRPSGLMFSIRGLTPIA